MSPQRIVASLIPLAMLSACPRVPIDFGKDGEAHTVAELLKRVDLAEGTVNAVKGDGKLIVESPQGKGAVTLFVAAAAPARIHLEQLDFFNRPQSVLTTDGKEFGFYDAQNGQFIHGPATRANLGRFLPMVMTPNELAALLLGRVPRVSFTDSELRIDDEQRLYVATLKHGDARQTLSVRPPQDRVEKSVVSGFDAWNVELSDVATYGAVTFPRHVVLDAPQAHTHVELQWKDFTLNESPDETLFDLTGPEGVPDFPVDADGHLPMK